jgi:hypothetical protein
MLYAPQSKFPLITDFPIVLYQTYFFENPGRPNYLSGLKKITVPPSREEKILLRVRRIEVAIFFLMLIGGERFPHTPPFISTQEFFKDDMMRNAHFGADRPRSVSRKTSEDGVKKSFLFEPKASLKDFSRQALVFRAKRTQS